MSTPALAIDSSNITGIGIGVIVVLVVLGFVIGAIVTKLIVRLIVAIVVVVLAIVVWQQRGHVQDEIDKKCQTGASFFGVHVDAPEGVKARCGPRS